MRVWPTSEAIRKILKHPCGIGFGDTMSESADWPEDQWTTRRIQDGDVTTQAPATHQQKTSGEKTPARRQAED